MFTGEWYFLDGKQEQDTKSVMFNTNSIDEAIILATTKFSLREHTKSRYFAILQDGSRRLVLSKITEQ